MTDRISTPQGNTLIYSPVALWRDHHPQVIEIAWRKYEENIAVSILHCNRAFSSCPTNRFSERNFCEDCVKQSSYSVRQLLPPNTRNHWYTKDKSALNLEMKVDSLVDLKNFTFKKHRLGLGVASHLISKYQDLEIPIDILKQESTPLLEDAILFYEFSLDLLKKEKITELYAWGGRRHTEAPIIFAAKELGIPIISFEIAEGDKKGRIHISHHNPFTFEGWRNDADAWIDKQKGIVGELKLQNTGKDFLKKSVEGKLNRHDMPYFMKDSIQNSSFFDALLNQNKRIVSIFSSSMWEYYAYPDWEMENDFADSYSTILRFCSDEWVLENFLVVVRWHPNIVRAGIGEKERVKQVITQSKDALHIFPEDRTDSYRLVELSDFIITFGSTIGLEASAMGKAVITLGHSTYSHLNFNYKPLDFNCLMSILSNPPLSLDPKTALFYSAYLSAKGEDFKHVVWHEGAYRINNKKIEYKSVKRKVRESKYRALSRLKSFFKFRIRSLKP
jgi:hypothetical protein